MKRTIRRDYVLSFLKELLETPSPSGFCREVMKKVEAEAARLGYPMTFTNKGCGVIAIPGQADRTVTGLSAHVDTLGAMVRSIHPGGTLRFTLIGGFMLGSVENEYCRIHTRDGKVYEGTILTVKPSVHVYPDARELKREEAAMEIRIDERVSSREDVLSLGIAPGDFISFDPRVRILDNGYIKSRHLDDKAGVTAVFGLLELLRREKLTPKNSLRVFISTYEEVGHGSSYIPEEIDELIAVDMGAMGDDLHCRETDVSICAKDSTGPYDYGMVSRLIELAKHEGIPYAVDIYPQYGSDASAALRAGRDIRAALLGPGVHASHSMERTHIEAVENTAALLAAYLLD
jgi:putative aminopeptidase FrvX